MYSDILEFVPFEIDEKDNIVAVKMLDSEYELNVIKKPAITGDLLVDAGVSYDNNKPMINFKFNSIGAKKFADITKNNMGNMERDLTTTTSKRARSIEVTTSFDYFENGTIYLEFSTDNIQNIIYFTNIHVTYTCGK